ncbi:hypothetical protein ACTXO1_06490 [Corynebacterium casei]|uniref:hypothetical protein n=1 Tax=Corynebacterium casei TaxID=160386 RepID=UPI003FD147B8
MNREQRRELIAESLKSDPQLSNREHARRTGASDTTVGTLRKEMQADGQVPNLGTSTGSDGKSYPASRPAPQPEPAPGITSKEVDELNQLPPKQPTRHPGLNPSPVFLGQPEGIGCSNV